MPPHVQADFLLRRSHRTGDLIGQAQAGHLAQHAFMPLHVQASFLDKHKLDIRLSMRGPSAAHAAPKAPAKKAEAAKLLVRNVAFEAAKKDIQALFAPMGQVKRCSLPRKFDGNHR